MQRAVVEGNQVELGHVARDRSATSRVVHPLGLATKGRSWYRFDLTLENHLLRLTKDR